MKEKDMNARMMPPILPKSLLNMMGEYGMARTDGLNELECQHRWLSLIDGIKEYAAAYAAEAISAMESGLSIRNSQDAARYQWLRSAPYGDAMKVMFDGKTEFMAWRRAGSELDKYIDSAICASKDS